MRIFTLARAPSHTGKKWAATFYPQPQIGWKRTKTVYFGQAGASDFTLHKSWARRFRYLRRHWKDLFDRNTNRVKADPRRAGFLSLFVLWGVSPSLEVAVRDTQRRYAAVVAGGTFPIKLKGWSSRARRMDPNTLGRDKKWAEKQDRLRGGKVGERRLPSCDSLPRTRKRSNWSGSPRSCRSPSGRVVAWPRRFSRKDCEEKPVRGFTMRSSCAAFSNNKRKKKQKTRRGRRVPERYVPRSLSPEDARRQRRALRASQDAYKSGKYVKRPRLKSFKSRRSPHMDRAERMYNVRRVTPASLAGPTRCSKAGLRRIVRKGMGAFASSGSRPNQTPRSWGYARLASATTGGEAARYDLHILEQACEPGSPALRRARARSRTPRRRPNKVRI